MPSIHGPSTLLPRALKDLSAQLLPRLRLIPEFRCWLPSASGIDGYTWGPSEPQMSQSSILWHSLAQGAPLIILLDLLGSRTGGTSLAYKEFENTDTQAMSAAFISEFLRRVEILEVQGYLSYGEIFKVNEFLDGSCSGFTKVLKTVQRVLNCLEATYPNLYELPVSIDRRKEDFFEHFNELETSYLEDLRDMKECVAAIEDSISAAPLALEYLAAHIDRIILYQEHIVNYLQTIATHSTDSILWNSLFSLKENMYILGTGAYRSYCTQFFSLLGFIDTICLENRHDETLHAKCLELSQQLRFPVDHVLSFTDTCTAALEIIHPVEHPSVFDALCSAHLALLNLKDDLLEVMRNRRTAYAKHFISNHTPCVQLDTESLSLGELVLSDCPRAQLQNFGYSSPRSAEEITMEPNILPKRGETSSRVYAFLFEQVLLLGRPLAEERHTAFPYHDLRSCYPFGLWDLGPALRGGGPFDVLCAITLAEVVHVYRMGAEDLAINVTWSAIEGGSSSTLLLTFCERKQLEQWVHALSRLVPSDSVSVHVRECEECIGSPLESSNPVSWQDELECNGRRMSSKARPWSLIARKEGTPSSSLYLFTYNNASEPSLFSPLSSPRSRVHRFELGLSASPRSLSSVRSHKSAGPITDPTNLTDAIHSIDSVLCNDPLDLTGQIRRIGNYPAAHGGFSDVWKCNWITGSQCYKVAVKVLRGKLLDIEREDKTAKRLQHEIKVWQRLDHDNVVPLYGTCSDFGRYLSLVCPWYENGSLYHYMRKHEDVLKLPERLKLLSEIAAGLAYLHSCSIVHGDLSSANILINDNGQACLCDFGLSTVLEDLIDSSYPSSMLGGAIRWSAPELYCVSCYDHDQVESVKPTHSMSSDIYSYGSIALEVLSGKVPYYYLKHDGQVLIELSKKVKPQRTPSPFLTNDLWDFIGECWNDNPGERPSTMHVSSQICLLHQRTLARHSM